jgi:hypothetical protein
MSVMMVASFVFAVFAGILLAFPLKVFVLVPATLLGVAVIQPKLTSIGTAVPLQIGYVLGLIIRVLLERWPIKSIERSGWQVGQGGLK